MRVIAGLALALMLAGCGGASGPTAAPSSTATPTNVPSASPEPTAAPTREPTAPPTPSPSPSPEAQDVTGTLELYDPSDLFHVDEPCEGSDGYGDLGAGMPVTVRDEGGEVIGATTLQAGEAGEPISNDVSEADYSESCLLPFELSLPRADFYTFELGRRGEITYSYQEMVGFRWAVSFTLGE